MEKIPNLHEIRKNMYPEEELIYTLDDMLTEEDDGSSDLEDTLYIAFGGYGTSTLIDVDAERRMVSIKVDADGLISVSDMQAYAQKVSDVFEKLGEGPVQFAGIQGGSERNIDLVFSY